MKTEDEQSVQDLKPIVDEHSTNELKLADKELSVQDLQPADDEQTIQDAKPIDDGHSLKDLEPVNDEQTIRDAKPVGDEELPVDLKPVDKQLLKGKRRRSKKFYIITSVLLLVLVLGFIASIVGYREYTVYNAEYHSDMSLAQAGIQHLRTASTLLNTLQKNPLSAPTLKQAQHEFTAAASNFVQLDKNVQALPAISTSIPIYGTRISAALHVLPLAIEASQAGILGCSALNILSSRFHDPLNAKAQGLTMADLDQVDKNFQQLKAILNLAINQVKHLTPSDLQLDPRLGKLVATFQSKVPQLIALIGEVEKLLPVVPTLLGIGKSTNYLIEILDSTELRPGGGFIGNYGILTLSGGRLAGAHITDTYLLDRPFETSGKVIPYPPSYKWFTFLASDTWTLRDSNLDADFPTAARYAEQNYRLEGGNVPVQGVIAITPGFIQQGMAITGPINVPEYHETVTVANLIDRIHYHQVGPGREGQDIPAPDGHSSLRKHFTELLAEHFLSSIRQHLSSTPSRLIGLVFSALRSKDLQIYLNSSIAEQLLQSYHFDATIQSPVGDGLFVVDANISPNKANNLITYKMDDAVTIDQQGNALHHTTLNYTWVTNGPVYGNDVYQDYVRVYAPPGSLLRGQQGWQPQGKSKAFGRQVWAGLFTLSYGQHITIALTWMVPSVVIKDASGFHYQYVIQRQAGSDWHLHLRITLPSCAVMKKRLGGLGIANPQTVVLAQSLNEDMNVGVDYTC